jgi:hypothetical protein
VPSSCRLDRWEGAHDIILSRYFYLSLINHRPAAALPCLSRERVRASISTSHPLLDEYDAPRCSALPPRSSSFMTSTTRCVFSPTWFFRFIFAGQTERAPLAPPAPASPVPPSFDLGMNPRPVGELKFVPKHDRCQGCKVTNALNDDARAFIAIAFYHIIHTLYPFYKVRHKYSSQTSSSKRKLLLAINRP